MGEGLWVGSTHSGTTPCKSAYRSPGPSPITSRVTVHTDTTSSRVPRTITQKQN